MCFGNLSPMASRTSASDLPMRSLAAANPPRSGTVSRSQTMTLGFMQTTFDTRACWEGYPTVDRVLLNILEKWSQCFLQPYHRSNNRILYLRIASALTSHLLRAGMRLANRLGPRG